MMKKVKRCFVTFPVSELLHCAMLETGKCSDLMCAQFNKFGMLKRWVWPSKPIHYDPLLQVSVNGL
jgi:hypothetical protein